MLTRRLLLGLIMYFAADFAVPLEPGPGRFVIEDFEEALAAPRSARAEARATSVPTRTTPSPRLVVRPRPAPTGHVTRPHWLTPPPLRITARSDRPVSPDAH